MEIEKFQSTNLKDANSRIARSLSIATGFVSFSGVIAVATIINQIIFRGDISFAAFMIVTVFSALVFGIIFLLVNQISRLSPVTNFNKILQKRESQSLSDLSNNQLPPHLQPVPQSVTEYTTRNLENVPHKRG